MSPVDRPPLVAGAGFGALGYFVEPDEWTRRLVRDVRAICEDHGIAVLDIEIVRILPDPDLHKAARIIDVGRRLGASNILVVGHDPDRTATIRQFRSICAMAGDAGMRAALEFMPFRSVANLRDAVEVVTEAGHPAGAVLIDSHHLHRSGGVPGDIRALPARMLPYAQICDIPADAADLSPEDAWREAQDGRLLPGAGSLPLRELIDALPHGCHLSAELIGPDVRRPFAGPESFMRAIKGALDGLVP